MKLWRTHTAFLMRCTLPPYTVNVAGISQTMFTTQLCRVIVCITLLGASQDHTIAATGNVYKPTILHEPTDQIYTVSDGDRTIINLRCYVISYRPEHTVSWYKDGMEINTGLEKYDTQQHINVLFTLAIESVTVGSAESDSGFYQCVVKENNTVLVRGRKAKIDIRVLSVRDTYPVCLKGGGFQEGVALIPGQTLLFTCVSLVSASLEWHRGQQRSLASEIRTDGVFLYEVLERTVSTEDDGAVYTCSQSSSKNCEIGPLSVYNRHQNESVNSRSFISEKNVTAIVIFVHVFFVVFVLIPCIVCLALRLKRRDGKHHRKSMIVRHTVSTRVGGSPRRTMMTPSIASVSEKVASQEQFWKAGYADEKRQSTEEEIETPNANTDVGDYVIPDIQLTWDERYKSLSNTGRHGSGDYVLYDYPSAVDSDNYYVLIFKKNARECDESSEL